MVCMPFANPWVDLAAALSYSNRHECQLEQKELIRY